MANDRVTCCAVGGIVLITIAIALVVCSSALPYWQEAESDDFSEVHRIGLWEICFSEDGAVPSLDSQNTLGERFYNCYYVFDRDLREIIDWIFPDWFITVAALVTLGLVLLPIAIIITVLYFLRVCNPHREHFLLLSSSSLCLMNGILTAIAIIVFGIHSDKDGWVEPPENVHLSYSFGICAFVPVFCFIASLFHFIEFLKMRAQKLLNSRAKIYSKGEFNNRF